MNAARLITALTDQGLTLTLAGDRLTVTPASSLSDVTRALIRDHKSELVALLAETRRHWLVVRPDSTTTSHSLNPPATLAEMQRWYPGAEIHPEPEPHSERNAA